MELDWKLLLPLFPEMPGTLALSSLVQPPIPANTSYAFKIYFSLSAYLDWGGGCPSFMKILAALSWLEFLIGLPFSPGLVIGGGGADIKEWNSLL